MDGANAKDTRERKRERGDTVSKVGDFNLAAKQLPHTNKSAKQARKTCKASHAAHAKRDRLLVIMGSKNSFLPQILKKTINHVHECQKRLCVTSTRDRSNRRHDLSQF